MQNVIEKTCVKYLVLVGRPRSKEGNSILFKYLFKIFEGFRAGADCNLGPT